MFIVALSSALESPFHILELQVATIRYMSIIGRTFLYTEKANLNKLRGMQHRKVAHRAYRR